MYVVALIVRRAWVPVLHDMLENFSGKCARVERSGVEGIDVKIAGVGPIRIAYSFQG